MELRCLSTEEVLRIHEVLVADFAGTPDPISPPGVKSMALLESAVGRQLVGSGRILKYPECLGNAATLLFGLVCNHPFHNGNKRTGLVAMLVHLDRNKLTLYNTKQNELFQMVLDVANHAVGLPPEDSKKGQAARRRRRHADDEVAAILQWLKRRAHRVRRGEREVSYRRLKVLLERFGYSLHRPDGNYIDVVKREIATSGVIWKRQRTEWKRIGSVGYPGEHTSVSTKDIKRVRSMCRLTEEHGFDSDAFYDDDAIIDSFVNKYRVILRRLASR